MQWDDLRIFLAVAREGSISGAAKRIKVQHSTVSRRIKVLEQQLGTRLIERKASGYELTSAGRRALGAETAPSSPEEFLELSRRESVKWAKIVKFSGARVD